MKLKLHIAKWIVRRNEKRNRSARRALRDHQRQEWSRIKHDERRTRGLRLYIAWTQNAKAARRSRQETASAASPECATRGISPSHLITAQPAH